ncbi:MAG: hypothetical protein ACTHK8_21930 [Ginsengibacter sp.]
MENIYKAYTKEINGKVFYFVKKFSAFPEIEDCPSILDEMGMHTNFYKACRIAKINDELAVNKLMNELHIVADSARVIRMPKAKSVTHSLLRNTHHAFFKFRWATVASQR